MPADASTTAPIRWSAMDVVRASGELDAHHKALLDLFAQVEKVLRDARVTIKVSVPLQSGSVFGWTRNPHTEQWGFSVQRETDRGRKTSDLSRAQRRDQVEAAMAIGHLIDAIVAETIDLSGRMQTSAAAMGIALEWLNARSGGSTDV